MQAPRFPGQIERATFTMEQAECLSSPLRTEVFWSFSRDEPRSIAEVASGIGKSANATTYHVNELVRTGLLIAVDERRRRSRTEKLYVLSARAFFSPDATAPKEYRAKSVEAYAAITRILARERAAINETFDYDTELADFLKFRRFTHRLSRERAAEFAERIALLLREFAAEPPDPDGVRVNFHFNMAPAVSESRKHLAEAKRRKSKPS